MLAHPAFHLYGLHQAGQLGKLNQLLYPSDARESCDSRNVTVLEYNIEGNDSHNVDCKPTLEVPNGNKL